MSSCAFIAWFNLIAAAYLHWGSLRASGARSWRQCRTVWHAHLGYACFVWEATQDLIVNVDSHSLPCEVDDFASILYTDHFLANQLLSIVPGIAAIEFPHHRSGELLQWHWYAAGLLVWESVWLVPVFLGNSSRKFSPLFLEFPTLKNDVRKAFFFSRIAFMSRKESWLHHSCLCQSSPCASQSATPDNSQLVETSLVTTYLPLPLSRACTLLLRA